MAKAKKKNAAHAKERKYTSQQGHEQAYKGKRKSKVEGYKEEGGKINGTITYEWFNSLEQDGYGDGNDHEKLGLWVVYLDGKPFYLANDSSSIDEFAKESGYEIKTHFHAPPTKSETLEWESFRTLEGDGYGEEESQNFEDSALLITKGGQPHYVANFMESLDSYADEMGWRVQRSFAKGGSAGAVEVHKHPEGYWMLIDELVYQVGNEFKSRDAAISFAKKEGREVTNEHTMKNGGKLDAAHAKEIKYTSQQKHEQDYKGKRKSKVEGYKAEGGGVRKGTGVVVRKTPTSSWEFIIDDVSYEEAEKAMEDYKKSGKKYHDIMIDDLPFAKGGSVGLDSVKDTKEHFGYSDSEWNKMSSQDKIDMRRMARKHLNAGKAKYLASIKDTKTHLGYSDSEWNKLNSDEKYEARKIAREDEERGKRASKRLDEESSKYFNGALSFLNY